MKNTIKETPQKQKIDKPKKFKKYIYYLVSTIVTILIIFFTVFAIGISVVISIYYNNLPSVSNSININNNKNTVFYNKNPEYKKSVYVPYNKISTYMIKSMISAEDVHFFSDNMGINFLSTLRSLYNDIFQKQIGIQGASTITQQLVKNTFLSNKRDVQNKIKEILLSIKISQMYSKKQILDAYLNDIYFGDGSYGIEAASQRYFGIPASKLDLAQAAMLAGVVQAPSIYSPISGTNPKLGVVRQIYVLNQMIKHENIIHIPVAEIIKAERQKLIYK